jgi:hypothetical protein
MERIIMSCIIIGVLMCFISIGLLISNKYQLLAGIILIVGVWIGIKGRNKINDKKENGFINK